MKKLKYAPINKSQEVVFNNKEQLIKLMMDCAHVFAKNQFNECFYMTYNKQREEFNLCGKAVGGLEVDFMNASYEQVVNRYQIYTLSEKDLCSLLD